MQILAINTGQGAITHKTPILVMYNNNSSKNLRKEEKKTDTRVLAEMIGRYIRPAHMFTTNARASESGLSFLRDIKILSVFMQSF